MAPFSRAAALEPPRRIGQYELSNEEDHAHLKVDLDFSERMSSVLSLVIQIKARSCVVPGAAVCVPPSVLQLLVMDYGFSQHNEHII